MKKYSVGSHLIGLNNTRDKDVVVVIEDCSYNENEDIHYLLKDYLDKLMNFEIPFSPNVVHRYLITYQYDKDIIGQDFPYEYHILDHRDKYIELLKYIVDTSAIGFDRTIYRNNFINKIMYHVAYLTFVIKNNSVVLTEEQKSIVQKIHDRQMPVEYLDELESIIRSLNS